ncbi:putative sister chromatid cohesion protein Pds5 [Dioscorea sansibarensis]
MADAEKELENRLLEVGNRLASPPSDVDELLGLLDLTESFLVRVDQSPSPSMSAALNPVINALVSEELFKHLDLNVKVGVASCISEITRITAPEAPYNDDLMKVVFHKIVETFQKLDDTSSRSYTKRVSILETVAKVRSCVVMLDLECDALILEMFHHFLKTIRSNHSEKVFSSIETIMTLVLEESEDISSELLSCLLACAKKNSEDVVPAARRLVEKVLVNCGAKLKPYLVEAVQSMGAPLSEYSDIIGTICQGKSEAHDGLHSSREHMAEDSKLSDRTICDDLPQGPELREPEVGYPAEDDRATEKPGKLVMSNGTNQMVKIGDADSVAQPKFEEPKPENLETEVVGRDDISNHSTKTQIGHKTGSSIQANEVTDHSHVDSDKEASAMPNRSEIHVKEAHSSNSDCPSGKETEVAASLQSDKKDIEPMSCSGNGDVQVASATINADVPAAPRPKRGRPPGSKTGVRQKDRRKSDFKSDHSSDKTAAPGGIDPKQDADFTGNPGGKSQKRSGKKVHAESAADGDTPTVAAISSAKDADIKNAAGVKPTKQTGKKEVPRKLPEAGSSEHKSSIKRQKGKALIEEGASEEMSLKEMISKKSASKMLKERSHLSDSVKRKARRKRASGLEETLEAEDSKTDLGEELVGSKVKVWWPDDNEFYHGTIDSFDTVTKRHTVFYDDGDVEVLFLNDERWKLIESGSAKAGGQAKETLSLEGSLEGKQRNKKFKSLDSGSKPGKEAVPENSDVSRGKSQPDGDESSSKLASGKRPRGRPKGSATKRTPKSTSGKPKEKPLNKFQESDSTASKNKEEPGKDTKDDSSETISDDTPMGSIKAKYEAPKADSNPKTDASKSGTKVKNAKSNKKTSKSAENAVDTTAKTHSVDVTTDKKLKEVTSRGSSEGSRRKRKASRTPASDGKHDANGSKVKAKAKVEETVTPAKTPTDSDKGRETPAMTGKNQRRKGHS